MSIVNELSKRGSQFCEAAFQLVKNTNTNAGGIAQSTGNQVTVQLPAASSVDTIAKVGLAAAIAVSAWDIGSRAYDKHISKDDEELMEKFGRVNCGLDNMPSKVEGCFRKYLIGAIYRTAQKMPAEIIRESYARFHQCFDNRPVHPCSFWGEDVIS